MTAATAQTSAPIVPPGIQQFFVPAAAPSSPVRYSPVVLGAARVSFGDTKLGIDEVRDVVYAAPFGSGAVAVDWTTATAVDVTTADLQGCRTGGRHLRGGAGRWAAGQELHRLEQGLREVAVAV